MERHFDTIIIGAGPAGSACGTALRKNGAEPCLIDKAVFPRNKTCAGLVTKKTYELISELFDGEASDGLFCAESDELRLYRRTELLTGAPLNRSVRLVNRRDFDNALVERYKELGGFMLEGERGYVIDDDSRRLTLKNGDVLSYDKLIYADGALSQSRRLVSVDKRKLVFGIEAYVPASLLPQKSVDIYFDFLKDGYIWVFPHGDTVCVGAAEHFRKHVNYRDVLSSFLRELGVDPDCARYIGAFLPCGYTVAQEKLPRHVMLIGDAAGFTDPITGEGLYMALRSGIDAAQAALTDTPKESYLKSVQPLIRIVNEGRKVQHRFYSPAVQAMFFKKARGHEALVSFLFENMVEDYHYDYSRTPQLAIDYKKQKR